MIANHSMNFVNKTHAVQKYIGRWTGTPDELIVMNKVYTQLFRGTYGEFGREYHVNVSNFSKFLKGKHHGLASVRALTKLVENHINAHALPQIRESTIDFIYSLIRSGGVGDSMGDSMFTTPIPFSLSIRLPTEGIKVVVFVDGDQIARIPEITAMFSDGVVGVHIVIVIANPKMQIQMSVLDSGYVTYISSQPGYSDSTDYVISMLVACYIAKHPIKYYIVSSDNFARSVVANVKGGKVIRPQKGECVIANLAIDLYTELPEAMNVRFSQYAKDALNGIAKYTGYHLARYFVVAEMSSIPHEITRLEALQSVQNEIGIRNVPCTIRVNVPPIDKYRKLLGAIVLPIDKLEMCAPLDDESARFFGVSQFEQLFEYYDVCHEMGIVLYNKKLYPTIRLHYRDMDITEQTLREMVREKMVRCKDHSHTVTGPMHANLMVFRNWLSPDQPNYETIHNDVYQKNIYGVLLSAVNYINS